MFPDLLLECYRIIQFAHIIKDEEELLAYDRYVLAQCDRTAEINFARDEGLDKGRSEGRSEVLDLIEQGFSIEEIKQRLNKT